MGCDIHCYIEYKKKNSDRWINFGGRINPGRNYQMFGTMAGVRNDSVVYIEPRGFPEDCGYSAKNDNLLYISEFEEEGHVSKEKAEQCVKYGQKYVKDSEGVDTWVTNPDFHSHSWLTSIEFEISIANYLKHMGFLLGSLKLTNSKDLEKVDVEISDPYNKKEYILSSICEYWPILKAMQCFEDQGYESRLVFWFDN